jgi:hypothetical protein
MSEKWFNTDDVVDFRVDDGSLCHCGVALVFGRLADGSNFVVCETTWDGEVCDADLMGTEYLDEITWKYDEGTYVKYPTTVSLQPVGTFKVGDHPNAPHAQHMTAIKVETIPTPPWMKKGW